SRPPTSTLFPYTTLFRSLDERGLRLRRETDGRLRQVQLVYRHPRGGGRRQGRGAAGPRLHQRRRRRRPEVKTWAGSPSTLPPPRSEEPTSELQSLTHIVC